MRENLQRFQRHFWSGSGLSRHSAETIWRLLLAIKPPSRSSQLIFFFIILFLGAFVSTRLLDITVTSFAGNPQTKSILTSASEISNKPPKKIEIPLNCNLGNFTRTCPTDYYPSKFHREEDLDRSSPAPRTCPEHFRWIHEDLRPWKETGITREMVERANRTANFRLVILDGKAYVETYQKSFQTRDAFTLWGILQLLRRYPGKVPDLDLMFDCVDWPVIRASNYSGPSAAAPPPLFRYCGDDATLDIVFPDWSFWGWPEINIKPWERLLEQLKEGNRRKKWVEREPYAYWKGNPLVAATRMDLLNCNVSDKQEWNARIFSQDWIKESQQGYKQSDLASQCTHRYKIYIEGSAWSVSEKYILACDSVTLIVKPQYYDFFTRSLRPVHHYWPIRDDDKCRSIKFAVDWGNSHKQKAQSIGKEASNFIHEELKMDYVYDYMFHLLSEYSKLLRYRPSIPSKAVELCSEAMACSAGELQKEFMMESFIKGPTQTNPCMMPPTYDPLSLHSFLGRKENSIKQVEKWETQFWESRTKQV